jgi:hypothetical protein
MEKRDNPLRLDIDGREIRTFVPIAIGAGERKVRERIVNDMLLRKDVFDMKGCKWGRALRQPAVFTAMRRPYTNRAASGGIHDSGVSQNFPSAGLQYRDEVEGGQIPVVFRLLVLGKRAPVRLLGQIIQVRLQFRTGAQFGNALGSFGSENLRDRIYELVKESRAHAFIVGGSCGKVQPSGKSRAKTVAFPCLRA